MPDDNGYRGLFEGPLWYKGLMVVGFGAGIAGFVVIIRDVFIPLWNRFHAWFVSGWWFIFY